MTQTKLLRQVKKAERLQAAILQTIHSVRLKLEKKVERPLAGTNQAILIAREAEVVAEKTPLKIKKNLLRLARMEVNTAKAAGKNPDAI